MKKTLALLLALAMVLSLCACGEKTETVELTPENIKDFISFSKNVTGGSYERSTHKSLGVGFVDYDGSGVYTLNAVANTEAKFEKVEITIEMVVGHGRTREEWDFLSGGKAVKAYSDDIGRRVKTVKMIIANDGDGSVSEEMILKINRLATDTNEVMKRMPSNLSDWSLDYKITDVTGNVIIKK